MTAQYYKWVADFAHPPIPSWANTWPGFDGCTNRLLSLTATNIAQPPSPGSPYSYAQDDYQISFKSAKTSGRTGRIPPYQPTAYYVGTKTRKEYLARTDYGTSGVNIFYQYGTVPKIGGACTPTESKRESTGALYSTYHEQQSASDFAAYPTYTRSGWNDGEILAQFYALRNELVAEASTAYDLLTDIAELKDVPRLINSITKDLLDILRLLKGRFGSNVLRKSRSISPIDLLKHPSKVFRQLGDHWMAYRYGVMPLVYSYRDAMKLMDRGSEVRTYKRRVVTPYSTGQTLPSDTSTYKVVDVTGSVTLRGCVFQFFTSGEIARLSGVGINPLATAWELIPCSFVFDWFINVSDYLLAACGTTWAQTKYACLSRKYDYTKLTSVHLPQRDKTYTVSNKLPINWVGAAPPATPNTVIPNPAGYQPLIKEVVKTYVRTYIPVSPVVPPFNPSLNWKRLIDGAYLSSNQLGRFFKRL